MCSLVLFFGTCTGGSFMDESNRKATNRNRSNQKVNLALKTKAGNKQTPKTDKIQ